VICECRGFRFATNRSAQATITQETDHLTIKFDADALDVPNPPLPAQGGQSLVQGVRIVDANTLAVDVGPRFGGFKAVSQPTDDTMHLVMDVLATQTETPPPPAGAATPSPAPLQLELPPSFGQPSAVRTIAIDPGHGGDDDGVKNADGAKEKELTLAVARRARSVIEARLGLHVLLTRDDDRSVPIDERTAIANNNKADLFISLHVNGSVRPGTAGAVIYCAEFDKDAARTAAAGGAGRVPAFGGGSREIELVPWDLAQTRHLDQSQAFAAILEQQFRDRVPLAGRSIDRAPLRVLESANMPAVVIEMGYLTNADQAKMLTGDAFQNALVTALFDAVVKFRDTITPASGTP
jgi:N-acetylmuramoyl-L-alanine amidase